MSGIILAVKLLAVGQSPVGVIAIGQVPVGVIAIGQGARGVIAIGQLACGVIAVGQLAIGVVGLRSVGTRRRMGGWDAVAGGGARPESDRLRSDR